MNVLDFLWTFFLMVLPEARLPAGDLENEPALKRKSRQTGIQVKIQEMEYSLRKTNFRNHKKTYLGF